MAAFYMSEELVGILRQEGAASELQTQVAQLFEESREDVFRYLMTLGLTPARAQDATQEVFPAFMPRSRVAKKSRTRGVGYFGLPTTGV